MADCLQNIIGLTDQTCACYEDDKPVDFATQNATDTGYYITDPEFGFNLLEEIDATGNCAGADVWEKLIAARAKAIAAFRTDLSAAVNDTHRHVLQTKDRMIGRLQYTSYNAVSDTYAGIVLKPRPYRDAKFVLQAIYLGLDTATDVTVTIKTNSEDIANASTFSEQTVTITTQANKFVRKALDTPLELPFYSIQNPDDLKYFIYYEVPEGARPLANKFYCCGKKPGYWQHLHACGMLTSQVTDTDEISDSGNSPHGVALEGYFSCSEVEWLCRLDELAGYSVQSVVGRAIQHKAAAFLISDILSSNKINRFTLKPKEELWGRRKYLNKEFSNAVQWIAGNLPSEAMDCLACKNGERFRPAPIMV